MNQGNEKKKTPVRRHPRKVQPGTAPVPSWMRRIHVPTEEQLADWIDAGYPPDDEIVASALHGFDLVWDVPDKFELFRLSDLNHAGPHHGGSTLGEPLRVQVATLSLAGGSFVRSHAPISSNMSGIAEHNFFVHLQAITEDLNLYHIKVIHGSRDGEEKSLVFEATDYPGAAFLQRVRVLRITVHEQDDSEETYATYEVVSDTTYPRSFI